MMPDTYLYLTFTFSIVFFLLFFIAFASNLITILLAALLIFLIMVLVLFYFNLELVGLLILLVVAGALLILILFSVFVLNQSDLPAHKSSGFHLMLFLVWSKIVYFCTNLKFYSFSQIWIENQLFEKESFVALYELNAYGFMLLIVGILLLVTTVGISQIFKKN